MSRVELKNWAKEKIKGHLWELLIPIIITSVLSSLTIGQEVDVVNGQLVVTKVGISLGIFFYFVQVGLAYFMIKFINDQEHELKDLFYFSKDYVRTFLTNLLQIVYIILWTLLLIVPGIIKVIAYSLVTFILADEKYNNLTYKEVLKKSEEMMDGHKMDCFMLHLSFVGWYILSIFTLGILLIWVVPYHVTSATKFLYDIKTEYEKK